MRAMTEAATSGGIAAMEAYNEKLSARADTRRARMKALREKGWTLERIGRKFGGISRQRVRAILAKGDD